MKQDEFPVGRLPTAVEELVDELAEKQGLSRDYLYASFLAVISVLIGNRYSAEAVGWNERPLLWIAIVGRSGIKKTPAMNMMTAPLSEINRRLHSIYKAEFKDHKEKDDKKPGEEKPKRQQLLVDDFTLEVLIQIMADNPAGLMVIKDELMGLVYDSNRYNKNGQEQRLLSIFSNQQISYDRKSDDASELIVNPYLTMLGGIQPKVLGELMTDSRMANGFVSRLLFAFPLTEERKAPQRGFDKSKVEKYEEYILRFTQIDTPKVNGTVETKILPLSIEAQDVYDLWLTEYIYSDLDKDIVEYKAKLEGYVVRISLILAFARTMEVGDVPEAVVERDMEFAFEICNYFIGSYKRACSLEVVETKEMKIEKLRKRAVELYRAGRKHEEVVLTLLKEGHVNAHIAVATCTPPATVNMLKKKNNL